MSVTSRLLSFIVLPLAFTGNLCAQGGVPAPPDSPPAFAYPIPLDRGAAALDVTLKKLRTRASLLMVTAHPDDEDGGVLAYESRGQGVDTSLLTLNRGEGGQNVMSSSYWDELGLLRTQELLAADRYYGVQQYWTRVADFGFSKTLQETLSEWGHERLLYDVVRVIRMTRPLVVTSVFAGNVSDGHGQHQAAGEIAQEAFKAAGDPNVFPDQIRAGLQPWAPARIYVRVPFARISKRGIYDYATGHWAPARFHNYVNNTWIEGVPSADVQIPVGTYNPLYGLSYMQLGRLGLNQQKSQNGGIGLPLPGPANSSYHLYGSTSPLHSAGGSPQSSFFDGLDVSLEGIAGYAPESQQPVWRSRLAQLAGTIAVAEDKYSPQAPEKVAPILANGLAQADRLLVELDQSPLPKTARYNMEYELREKQKQLNEALIESLGLNVLAEAMAPDAKRHKPALLQAIPDSEFEVSVHVANQGKDSIELVGAILDAVSSAGWQVKALDRTNGTLAPADVTNLRFSVRVPAHPSFTRPYFTRPTIEQAYYDIDDPRYLNLSTSSYPLMVELTFRFHGAAIRMVRVIQTERHVAGEGPVLDPLLTVPSISLWMDSRAGVVPLSKASFHLKVTVHGNVTSGSKGSVRLELPQGWRSVPSVGTFSIAKAGDQQDLDFEIHCTGIQARSYSIRAVADYMGEHYSEGYQIVGYDGLRPYPYYRAANYRVEGADLNLAPNLKIGYVMGTGDDVPQSLADLGLTPDFLSPRDLATQDLSKFDAIVVGIRAYAAHPELATVNSRLLDYVRNGGALIVQYQTPEFDHDYGPYPFSLGDSPEKVVEEKAPVRILLPNDPVFTWPNKITPADFSGWIEERGHDFLSTWDSKYVALTEVHDQGQAPQEGGLIYARYGRGVYVYSAFAFYRQLPEGVPGAYRIFANLLSLSKNPGLTPGH